MKLGAEEKRKRIAVGVLGAVALGTTIYMFEELYGGTSSPPPSPPMTVTALAAKGPTTAAGPAAVKLNTSAQLDPTLHMEAMLVTESLVYSGTGRNIFAAGSEAPPVVIAKNQFPPRPGPTPPPPPPQPKPGPPPLPPINLKFFGTATSQNGTRRAFLLNGDDVFVASAGDVVERRYRVVSIAANSVLVEDIPNSNKQTLPLMLGP